MVANSSNYGSRSKGALGKSGVVDWIVQRKTAVFLAVYFSMLMCFFCCNEFTYANWVNLFEPWYFKALTVIFLICLVQHAWIGIWVIATDYLDNLLIRGLFLFLSKLFLIGYLVWGIYILFA